MEIKTKLDKMNYLERVLRWCEMKEPTVDLEEIALVVCDTVSDIEEFIKQYKKHKKKTL